MTNGSRLERRLRLASGMVGAGLAVEAITLYWTHPLVFVVFLMLGGSLVGLGILLFLWSIVP
jgi:hypothetical protein